MRLVLALLSLMLMVGCARVNVSTEIRSDGSFKRQVVFAALEGKEPGMSPKLEDIFVIPKATSGLTVSRTTKDDEAIVTVTRDVPSGMKAVKDAVTLVDKKPQLENEASVTSLGDGRWLYSEKLKWVGEKPPEDMSKGTEFRAFIKKALPPTADTATIDRVTRRAAVGIWQVLFGPNEPMLSLLFMHPSLAERRFRQRVSLSVDSALAQEGVSPEKRKELLLELAKEADVRKILNPKQEAERQAAKAEGSGPGLVPMLFTAKVPGEILETNGEVDTLSGEVFWALYPEAAAVEDVELRVVYRP